MNNQTNLTKICKDLMFEQPFYGLLLLNLQKEWSERVPTAGVGLNGINYKLYINPNFWTGLSEDQKKGLIIHELMHIAFFHITEYKHLSDHQLANIAQDIEINQKIDVKFLPPDGCTIDKFEEYNLLPHEGTNIYYKKLQQKKQEQDDEIMSAIKQAMQDKENGTGDGTVKMPDGSTLKLPEHDWDEFEDISEAQGKLIDRQLATILNDVIEQTIKSRGTVPQGIEHKVDKLLKIEPAKFNWKSYLRRYIGNSIKSTIRKTKRKQSKRFVEDFGLKINEFSHVLIGIDSSASVSDKEIYEFINELKHMYKTGHDFTLIFADTQMQEPIKYKPNIDIVIKKRGGTDFNPVVDYYHQHKSKYSTLIYLTDGEAPLPDNPIKNMLWVLSTISSDADHLKESGKVIKLN